jgi:aspartate aminotransferase-like enzyme
MMYLLVVKLRMHETLSFANIRLTGPTPLPPSVRKAISRQIISHRSVEFKSYLERILQNLQYLMGTSQTPMIFTASGTGGLEAAIVNSFSRSDTVLSINSGYFANRFAKIAENFGLRTFRWELPYGSAIDPEELRKELRRWPKIDGVLLTHNESSTGTINNIKKICQVIREETQAKILVDAITSVGAVPIEMDALGIDVLITASQKALMSPPGLAIIAASSRILKFSSNFEAFYFSFKNMQKAISQGTTTYTPAILSIIGLDTALNLINKEGFENVCERHAELSKLCREELGKIGFKCFAERGFESPTISAFFVPPNWSASSLQSRLAEKNILVSIGHDEWKEKILRIGHMGYVNKNEIIHIIKNISEEIYKN